MYRRFENFRYLSSLAARNLTCKPTPCITVTLSCPCIVRDNGTITFVCRITLSSVCLPSLWKFLGFVLMRCVEVYQYGTYMSPSSSQV